MEAYYNIKFLREVEKYPVLYDYTLAGYMHKDLTKEAWDEISIVMKISVSECKEKWTSMLNALRMIMRDNLSGAGKEKTSYLAEAMKFAIPYLREPEAPSENIPPIPEQGTSAVNTGDEPEQAHHEEPIYRPWNYSEPQYQEHHAELQPVPRPPSLEPQNLTLPSSSFLPLSQPPSLDRYTPPGTSGIGFRSPTGIRTGMKRSPSTDSDELVKDVLAHSIKTAKLGNFSVANDKKEGTQQFLNSLIPDLMQMNDVQLRFYKIKVLKLIDEVMEEPPAVYNPSSYYYQHPHQRVAPSTSGSYESVLLPSPAFMQTSDPRRPPCYYPHFP